MFEDNCRDLLMELLPTEEFHVDGLDVKAVALGKDVKSTQYGKLKCLFVYNKRTYVLHYNVHVPRQGSSRLSNSPEWVDEIIQTEEIIQGEKFTDEKRVESSFGHKAFWLHTPLNTLEGEDYLLRALIVKITEYSRREQLCKQFRKLDVQALKVNPIYKVSFQEVGVV